MPDLKLGTSPEDIEALRRANAAAVPLTRGEFLAFLREFRDTDDDEDTIVAKIAARWGIALDP